MLIINFFPINCSLKVQKCCLQLCKIYSKILPTVILRHATDIPLYPYILKLRK